MELLTRTKTCWSKQAQGMYMYIIQNIAKAQRTRGLSSVFTKVTSLGHITCSCTNLDQILSS